MNTSGGENQRSIPVICANSCGFYGSAATNNLCSKCYKAFTRMKQQNIAADQSVKTESPLPAGTPPFSATNSSESTESSLNAPPIDLKAEGNGSGTHQSSPLHFPTPESPAILPLSSPILKEQLLQISADGTRMSRAAAASGAVSSSSVSAVQGTCTPSSSNWLSVSSEASDVSSMTQILLASSCNRVDSRSDSGINPNQSAADTSAGEISAISLNACHPPSCEEPIACQHNDIINNNEESSLALEVPNQQVGSRITTGDPLCEADGRRMSCNLQTTDAKSSGFCGSSDSNSEHVVHDSSSVPTANLLPASALATGAPGQQNSVQVNKGRCYQCNKKVGLLGFQCRCGFYFCGAHRHADMHSCAFDFKAFGKQQLRKANQKVVADKLNKL